MECTDIYSGGPSVELLQKQYEEIINKINVTRARMPIVLNDIQERAETVFLEFFYSQDIGPATQTFDQLDLEIDRKITLKKIELLCTDLYKTEEDALELGLSVKKIGDSVRYIFQDAQEYIPTASKSQVIFHERAAHRKLLIAKSEFNKKITYRQMELFVSELNPSLAEAIKEIFEEHAALLYLSNTEFLLSLEKKTTIFESFLDELAFLEDDKAIYRSNDNKVDAISHMKKMLKDIPLLENDEQAKKILEEHTAKLKPEDTAFLCKYSDCHEVIISFVNSIRQLLK